MFCTQDMTFQVMKDGKVDFIGVHSPLFEGSNSVGTVVWEFKTPTSIHLNHARRPDVQRSCSGLPSESF